MKKLFGLLALGGLLFIAAPAERAAALSLATPAATESAKLASEGMVEEVRHRRGHRMHHHHGMRRHHMRHHRHHHRHMRRW